MSKDFQSLQYQLAAHLRDPRNNPPPAGMENRRLDIYRNLFFNNIVGFISSAFPVLRKFYTEDDWHALVRRFYAHHKSHSPYFAEISKEFLDYLKNEYHPARNDPPFMSELAHYEWVELALSLAEEDIDDAAINPDGDLLDAPPVLSPLAWRLVYRWPVHRIGPDFRPENPGDEPTRLVVCRDRNDEIGFMALNAVTDLLLDEIAQHPQRNGREQIEAVVRQMQLPDLDAALENGAQILKKMRARDVILGTVVMPG